VYQIAAEPKQIENKEIDNLTKDPTMDWPQRPSDIWVTDILSGNDVY
jgi:hypothetical protein